MTRCLYDALICEDGGLYVGKTGSLIKGNSLRTRRNKKIFKMILEAERTEKEDGCLENDSSKRFWTKKTMSESLQMLVSEYEIKVPQVPGFTWKSWFEEQSRKLHALVKKAKRNCRGMDAVQTLPFDPEEPICISKLIKFCLKDTDQCSHHVSLYPVRRFRRPWVNASWRRKSVKFLGSSC